MMASAVRGLLVLALLSPAAMRSPVAFAQSAASAPSPAPIEEVPYVRTPQTVVDRMLELGGVRGSDFVVDLGSGDGRVVITAAKRYGARGLGVDIDAHLVAEATRRAQAEGVSDRVRFEERDLFDVDLRPATVVTLYLLPAYNLRLRPKLLQELRPGARVISHDWDLGDWTPDYQAGVDVPDKPVGLTKSSNVYVWIVPANAGGRWTFSLPRGSGLEPAEARIEQKYQELGGTLRVGSLALPIERGAIQGALLTFRAEHPNGTIRFQGRVAQDRIEGRVAFDGERSQPWRALRVREAGAEAATPAR